MIGIICIEDENGMLFHDRRVSRDRLLIDWLMQRIGEKQIWMRPYSKELFAAYEVKVAENYLELAKEGDYCFIEDGAYAEHQEKMTGLILCRWNRRYPSDLKFQESILEQGWQQESSLEIKGSSHKSITIEEWKKNA